MFKKFSRSRALLKASGGIPTLVDGLKITASKAGPIFGYVLIATTISKMRAAYAPTKSDRAHSVWKHQCHGSYW